MTKDILKRKRSKRFGISIRLKILIPTILMNIIIATVLCTLILEEFNAQCIETGARGALSIVTLAEARINGDTMLKLASDGSESTSYIIVYDAIESIVDSVGVDRIYTVGYNTDGTLCYLVDINADKSDGFATWTPVDDFVSLSARVAMSNNIPFAYKSIRTEGTKQIIVAASPVTSKTGEVTGAVFIEYDAASLQESISSTTILVIIIAVIIVIICSILMLFITGGILQGVRRVNKKVQDIVETDGDLTQKIAVRSSDEIGTIAGNINSLLDYIRTVITNISTNTKTLNEYLHLSSESAENSSVQISNISNNMLQMSAAMEETMASAQNMEEAMIRMNQYISDMAHRVSEGTSLASSIDTKAAALVESARDKSASVREMAAMLEQSLREKLEASKEVENIGELTKKILDISSQTELLSLNANIEAAKAGDAGKGFAVVADEIGKLSKDTMESAQAIQDISNIVLSTVRALADESENMLNFMNEQTLSGYGQLIETGTQYSTDAESIYGVMDDCMKQASQLANEIDKLRDAMSGILLAVEESTKNIEDVTDNINTLSEDLFENKNQSENNLIATDNLENEVNKFII